MASSENLASVEPWAFRSVFSDPWISEAYTRETETLTKALQKSLSNENSTESVASETMSPFLNILKSETAAPMTPTVSGVSGSDPETGSKRQRNAIPTASGKVSKRKSRASKKLQTTFITADPANFRQMVQQVTGVRFGGGGGTQMPAVNILKPEPYRASSGRIQMGGGCLLPTLDTSAFLLDRHQQQQVVVGSNSGSGSDPLAFQAAGDGGAGGSGFDFDAFASFPTLESWKVM